MKKVLFIGNRLNVLKHIGDFPELNLLKVCVLEDSLLHHDLKKVTLPDATDVEMFNMQDKQKLFDMIQSMDFDVLISNGCPFILPVSKMKKESQLYINIHPTLLPALKGKTPLSGVFMTHSREIGATMHYIDDGIDTGTIIAQEKTSLTPDLDQGLVYVLSFNLESAAFTSGMRQLIKHSFDYAGEPQMGEGSYFNRTPEMQQIDMSAEPTDIIMDKIRSFGVRTQGSSARIGEKEFKIYAAEKIVNEHLLNMFKEVKPGDVAFEYDRKLLVKTSDGMIKITDYENA